MEKQKYEKYFPSEADALIALLGSFHRLIDVGHNVFQQ
jgi:hypothetical protein